MLDFQRAAVDALKIGETNERSTPRNPPLLIIEKAKRFFRSRTFERLLNASGDELI